MIVLTLDRQFVKICKKNDISSILFKLEFWSNKSKKGVKVRAIDIYSMDWENGRPTASRYVERWNNRGFF